MVKGDLGFCDSSCKCTVECDQQWSLTEGELPNSCSPIKAECKSCACESSYIKHDVTGQCVSYKDNCNLEHCYYNGTQYQDGEMYWKGTCQECVCVKGNENCTLDVCKLTSDNCFGWEVLVIETGVCCLCVDQELLDTGYEKTTTTSPSASLSQQSTASSCTEESPWNEGDCDVCACNNGVRECNKTCNLTSASCLEGHALRDPDITGECCKCYQNVCTHNGTVYQEGSSWKGSQCSNCTCDNVIGGLYASQVTCRPITCDLNCDELTEVAEYDSHENCCPSQCVAKPAEACVSVNTTVRLNISGCESEPVAVATCSGQCKSGVTVLSYSPFIQSDCNCCQGSSYTNKNVTLTCVSGSTIVRAIPIITSCSCAACGASLPLTQTSPPSPKKTIPDIYATTIA